jgi:exodeoxyribonuclease V alpha subunit
MTMAPESKAYFDDATQGETDGIGLGYALLIDTLCRLSGLEADDTRRASLRQGLVQLAEALRQGSLRVPLNHLDATFVAHLNQGAFDAIVGGPDAYKPLICDDQALYAQLTFVLECDVAALLRDRIVQTRVPLNGMTQDVNAADPTLSLAPEKLQAALTNVLVTHPLRNRQGTPLDFSGARETALRQSLQHRLFAITGGPGTGKTSLSANLLRLHRRMRGPGLRIALAAPTGRAAARLTESLRHSLASLENQQPEEADLTTLEATTLHRLLGYDAGTHRFRRQASLPIEADLILVDEASMVDLKLFRALLRATPASANLILLGDADQLPSVEAGSLLADLGPRPGKPYDAGLEAQPQARQARETLPPDLPWVTLRGSHRSAPPLLEAAESILHGDISHILIEKSSAEFPADPQGATLWPLARESARPAWESTITTWFRRQAPPLEAVTALRDIRLGPEDSAQLHLHWPREDARSRALQTLWNHLKRSRLLAVLRHGPEGVEGLNTLARKYWQADYDPQAARHPSPGEAHCFHGAPILLQRNDFERGLANGDLGIALRIEGKLWVAFEATHIASEGDAQGRTNGFRLWPYAVLPEPGLAFATTVHKSQGSEFEEIFLVLPSGLAARSGRTGEHPLLSREVVYTALTRAQKAAWILGDQQALQFAANNSFKRESGLRDRLARLLGNTPESADSKIS